MALCQCGHVLLNLLFGQGVDEEQAQGHGHEADGGGNTGDVEDAHGDLRVKGSGSAVTDHGQQAAGQAGRERLTQLAGKGVDRIDGAVLTDAVADLGIIDDIGDHCPDDGVEEAQADEGGTVEADIDPDIGGLENKADDLQHRGHDAGYGGQLFFTEPAGQLGGKGCTDEQDQHAAQQRSGRLGGGAAVEVGEHIACHTLHGQHGQQQEEGGSNDAQQGTVGEHALEHLANVHLAVVGGHIHTLTHQVKAEQVAEDGADRENACNDGHAAAGEDRLTIDGDVSHHGGANADHKAGQGAADGTPGGQLCAVLGVSRDGGSHGAVRDVDGGVEDRAPQDIGHKEPCHLEAVGHPGQTGLEDEEGCDGHRAAHPLEPGAELAVLGGLGAVHDLAHGHIGKGIHKAGDHHDHAHNTGAHAHHVGIELHQEAGRQDKSKIVGEIAEHIADLVPHPKRGGLLHFICHCILLRWSIQTVQCPFCCIQVCTPIL